MAAARQKEMKESMTVLAITTLVPVDREANVPCMYNPAASVGGYA